MRWTLSILTLLFSAIGAAPVQALDAPAVVAAKQQLQAGVDAGDVATILAARAAFQSQSRLEPEAALLHYWVAVADWRAVTMLLHGKSKDPKVAERYCEEGLAEAERALELDPEWGGALAVKVGLQGLSMSFKSQIAMMTLGPKMEGDMGRALGLAGEDPRVHLLDGINTLHKPGFVGGGAKPSLAKFVRAIELFAKHAPSDSTAPDWGRDDALLWAGRAALKLDDPVAAKSWYERALEVNPRNAWVRMSLLPEVEKVLASRSGGREKS